MSTPSARYVGGRLPVVLPQVACVLAVRALWTERNMDRSRRRALCITAFGAQGLRE
jgi:hypothetical protein